MSIVVSLMVYFTHLQIFQNFMKYIFGKKTRKIFLLGKYSNIIYLPVTQNEPIFSVSTSSHSLEITKLILNNNTSICLMIRGVSPLRGFPVERRGIGHLVPILGGQRLTGLVRLGGRCVSISRLPVWYGGPARWPSANTAWRTRRSAGIHRIWPSQ